MFRAGYLPVLKNFANIDNNSQKVLLLVKLGYIRLVRLDELGLVWLSSIRLGYRLGLVC